MVEDRVTVQAALNALGAGMDFADALHLASASGATKFLTFDRSLGGMAARSKASASSFVGAS